MMEVSPKPVLITVKKAIEYMHRNGCNRTLYPKTVGKYQHDMKTGKWTACPDPIVFFDNGELAIGQHRLQAIINSGCPQHFIIVTGLPMESALNLDTQRIRSFGDNYQIRGILEGKGDERLSNTVIAMVRGIEEGNRSSKNLSHADRERMLLRHGEAAHWAEKHGPKGHGIRVGPVLCAVARAWYVESNKEKLARFCEVVSKGFANNEAESAAVALRNYLQSNPEASSSVNWLDTFLRTQNAVYHFMSGKKLMVIRHISEERYPLRKR